MTLLFRYLVVGQAFVWLLLAAMAGLAGRLDDAPAVVFQHSGARNDTVGLLDLRTGVPVTLRLGSVRVEGYQAGQLIYTRPGPDESRLVLAREVLGAPEQLVAGDESLSVRSWTADAGVIAFTAWRRNAPDVFLSDGEGGAAVYPDPESRALPFISPDGRFLMSSRMDTRLTTLTDLRDAADYPQTRSRVLQVRWSPDLQRLLYLEATAGNVARLRMIDTLPGGEPRTVYEHSGGVPFIAWAPDGERYAFVTTGTRGRLSLYIAEPDAEPVLFAEYAGRSGEFAWSPDGERLALFNGTALYDALTVIGTDDPVSRLPQSLATGNGPGTLSSLRWSPDGTRLAYSETLIDPNGVYSVRLTLLNLDTGTRRVIGGGSAYALGWWQP